MMIGYAATYELRVKCGKRVRILKIVITRCGSGSPTIKVEHPDDIPVDDAAQYYRNLAREIKKASNEFSSSRSDKKGRKSA